MKITTKYNVLYMAIALGIAATTNAQTTINKSEKPAAEKDAVEEIVVSGMRESLAQSLEIKREATAVVDAIVAEDMGKFPEANVAEALQRIPGVYLSRDGASNEGNRISIRGLGPQYAVTTINGAPVHTTSAANVGGSTRDFNYDVFPSDLFGQVNVYKTPLAELNEGGIGGTVDLQTPRPFNSNGEQIRYSAIAVYNTSSEQTNPRGSLLYSNTWDNFGVLVGVAVADNTNTRSGYEATGGYNSSALGSLVPYKGAYPFKLDYSDPRTNFGGYTQAQIDNAFLPRFHRAYASENERERHSEVVSLQYKTDQLDVSLDSIFANLKDSEDEYTFGIAIRNSGLNGVPGMVPINVSIDKNNNLQGTFGNANYFGESYIYDSETKFRNFNLRADYKLSDTLALNGQLTSSKSEAQNSPNRIFMQARGVTAEINYEHDTVFPVLKALDVDFTDPTAWAGQRPDLNFGINNEDDEDKLAKFGVTWDYNLGDWEGKLKSGLSYVESSKSLQKRNGTNAGKTQDLGGGLTFNTMTSAQIASHMQRFMPIKPFAKGAGVGFPKTWSTFSRKEMESFFKPDLANANAPIDYNNKFVAEEDVTGFFVQTDLKGEVFARNLKINMGLRHADTDVHIDNYTLQSGQYVPNQRDGSYDHWLPALNLAYDLRDDVILRSSWGRSITRAGLIDIAANLVIPNPFNAIANAGNPNLLPQLSDQYDAGVEWYFAEGGMLSAGAFWKDIKDSAKVEQVVVPWDSLGLDPSALGSNLKDQNGNVPPGLEITVNTRVNQGSEKLSGLEFAYQQNFTFLPAPFDGLGALASYTLVDTKGIDWITNDGVAHKVWTVPENGYSATLFYEKNALSLRLTYSYKDKFIIDTTNTGNDLQRWHAGAGFLDATIGYKLTDKLEIKLDALNLNDALAYDYFENPQGKYGSGDSRKDYAKYNGRTLMLGIRGSF